jgi:excisionase family DNA binding protein
LEAIARLTDASRHVHGQQAVALALILFQRATMLFAQGAVSSSVPPEDPVLTCREAGKELRFHPETIRVMCRRGELKGLRRGRSWRIFRSAVEQWKRDHMTG